MFTLRKWFRKSYRCAIDPNIFRTFKPDLSTFEVVVGLLKSVVLQRLESFGVVMDKEPFR